MVRLPIECLHFDAHFFGVCSAFDAVLLLVSARVDLVGRLALRLQLFELGEHFVELITFFAHHTASHHVVWNVKDYYLALILQVMRLKPEHLVFVRPERSQADQVFGKLALALLGSCLLPFEQFRPGKGIKFVLGPAVTTALPQSLVKRSSSALPLVLLRCSFFRLELLCLCERIVTGWGSNRSHMLFPGQFLALEKLVGLEHTADNESAWLRFRNGAEVDEAFVLSAVLEGLERALC